ncbi:MAG: hypothetical protein D4S01_01335 [Dehalococcoidia bacterium]|nr:MAG: hypothetical protein D4S01_01335 [Dehalococcoidia bacterium]
MNPDNIWINVAITLGAIAVTFVVILYFMRLERKKESINPSKVVAFVNKYSLVFGAVFIIVGLALWIPILYGSENVFGYESQGWWNEGTVVMDAAYFNIPFFLQTFVGVVSLLIGIGFIYVGAFGDKKR